MNSIRSTSPWQFTIFRIVFGLYLVCHFAALLPYGAELFSNTGLIADPSLNPTHGIFPNPLALWDSPTAVTLTLSLAIIAALLFTAGIGRIWMALILWFLTAAFFHRNNLTSNPSIPYLGLILLLSTLVPTGEPLSRSKRKGDWFMPKWILPTAALLLAFGYTFSGWTKLSSPSWIDGTALAHVLQNPLARPSALRDFLLNLPPDLLRVATWAALLAELFYLPLTMIHRTRPWIWLALIGMHLSLIFLIDFADLSLGMLMIHLFTFDPRWLPARDPRKGTIRIAFDDDCLMCNRFLHFLSKEDPHSLLRFEPLPADQPRTTMTVTCDGSKHERSNAVLVILTTLGGHWRALALLGKLIPRPLRDLLYNLVANNRHRFFKSQTCPLPSEEVLTRLQPPFPLPKANTQAKCSPRFTKAGISLLLFLCLFTTIGCGNAPLHNGRIPFSLLERPPGGNHLDKPDAAFREILRYSPDQDLTTTIRHLQIGDVLAFHMSHRDATAHLRQGTIQKLPYELFSFGHLALVVENPADRSGPPRLLQLAMKQAANITDGYDYLADQSWIAYRPTSPLDHDRLNEFVSTVIIRASSPRKAYDYTGALGIHNRSITPESPSDISYEYTCTTLVQAALHYAGHPTRGVHFGGFLDIVTPAQVIRAGKRE